MRATALKTVSPGDNVITLTTATAAHNLAVRYRAFAEAMQRAHREQSRDAFTSLSVWSGMLLQSQEETGAQMRHPRYLEAAKRWAVARLEGNGRAASEALAVMCDPTTR